MQISNLHLWVNGPYILLNQSFLSLLTSLPGMTCVGQAENLREVLIPHVDLILQILPSPTDLTPFNSLQKHNPSQKVLLFALEWTTTQARVAMQAGAIGCLSGDMQVEAFAAALRQAGRGEIALPANLQQALIQDMLKTRELEQPLPIELTDREREVVTGLVNGLSNKEIAQELYLSVRTIENHLARIYQKSGANSRTETAVRALQEGWLKAD